MVEVYRGKILVIGSCEVSKRVVEKILKVYNMRISDFIFVPYDKVKSFDFEKVLNSNKYTDIFVGPTPHKAKHLEGSTSPNQFFIDNQERVAPIITLRQKNGNLGISKENFIEAILQSNKFRQTSLEVKPDLVMG